jgi:hypothetical protein
VLGPLRTLRVSVVTFVPDALTLLGAAERDRDVSTYLAAM